MIKEAKMNNRGITLIALVVTIIVLLILSTIALTTMTGREGIIQTAKSAQEEMEIKSEMKIVDLSANQARNMDKYGDVKQAELENNLSKNTGNKTEVTPYPKTEGETELYFVKFNDSERVYVVTTAGVVKYIGKGDNAGIIFAKPKSSITPKLSTSGYQIDVIVKTYKENKYNQIEYAWTDNENTEPSSYKGTIQLGTANGENERASMQKIKTEEGLEDGQYFLWIKIATGEGKNKQEIIEHFGPYIIGESIRY